MSVGRNILFLTQQKFPLLMQKNNKKTSSKQVHPTGLSYPILLFQGFCLTLLSELRTDQHSLVRKHIQKCLEVRDNVIAARIPRPHPSSPSEGAPSEGYREVGSFWLHCGPHTHHMSRPENYILTESVKKNLKNLCRAISAR